jgi:hypothetical protein
LLVKSASVGTLNYVDIIGYHILSDIETMDGKGKNSLKIKKVKNVKPLESENNGHTSLADIMLQIDNIYGPVDTKPRTNGDSIPDGQLEPAARDDHRRRKWAPWESAEGVRMFSEVYILLGMVWFPA